MTDETRRPEDELDILLGSSQKGGKAGGSPPVDFRESGKSGGDPDVKRLREELMREKERALKAEILLKEKENARLEMESLFKTLKDQLQHDKLAEEMEQERINARTRVEVLEKRLEEMNALLLKALQERERATDYNSRGQAPEDSVPGHVHRDALVRLEQALEKIRRQAEIVLDLNKRLDQSAAERKDALEQVRKEYFQSQEKLESLAAKQADALAQLESELAQANRKIDEDVAASGRIIERLNREKEALDGEIAGLKREIELNDQALAASKSETAVTLARKAALEAERDSLVEKVGMQAERAGKFEQDLAAAAQNHERTVAELKAGFQKMRRELENGLEEKYRGRIKDLESRLEASSGRIGELLARPDAADTARKEKEAMEQELLAMTQVLREKEKALAALEIKFSEAAVQNKALWRLRGFR